jgi:hypothetical protein
MDAPSARVQRERSDSRNESPRDEQGARRALIKDTARP